MRETLIFMKENELRPAGGPSGYCYSIYQEVKKQNIKDIFFLPPEDNKKIQQVSIYRKITSYFPRCINGFQIAVRRKHEYESMMLSPKNYGFNFNEYDFVHFHSTVSLYKYRRDLENFKGKIILTSHSPVPQHQEIFAELPTKIEKKVYRKFYSALDVIDEYAFERADYVLFPCRYAEESYLKNWSKYSAIHDRLEEKNKLVYIPTGIIPKKVLRDRSKVCLDYTVDPNSFIVSYAGRHNLVKGYDQLQEIAINEWKRGNDYQFLVCGKESPLSGLRDERWTEVGWTDDAQSIIAASDVFILPNRETYFDIIMLEVLSSGKLVIASRTGGNKFFEEIKAEGIFLYDTIEEACDLIEKIAAMSTEYKQKLEEQNKELFNKCFTTKVFLNNYRSFLNSLDCKEIECRE